MEAAFAELPLALFTTLAPIGAGAFVALAIAFLTTPFSDEQLKRIDIDALNRVLDGLPVVMDSINSLQSQMQGIADTLGGLSLSSLLGLS